ncbi:Protein 21.1 [Giardia lamblia P15]|uniref:Protein 21.1 n=1 Tax=Giardia intestinalis (strain P15) TaxID=658858 RepID=E1F580_GIAIA|nr:Protein 21.1 [Giardia lamblia P15]
MTHEKSLLVLWQDSCLKNPMPLDTVEDWFKAVEADNLDLIEDNVWIYGPKKNENGETALMMAVRKKRHVIIPVLMPNAITLCNNEGKTALMIAAELDDPDACSLLIESEANICTSDGKTALHIAAISNAYHAVRALTESLEVSKDKNGRTALDLAIDGNCLRSVKALLAHGTWTRYGQLKDYLQIAEKHNYNELAEYLQGIIAEIPQNATDDMYLNRVIDPIEDAVSTVPSVSNIKVDDPLITKVATTLPPPNTKNSCCEQCVSGVCPISLNAHSRKLKGGAARVIAGLVVVTLLSILFRSFLNKE